MSRAIRRLLKSAGWSKVADVLPAVPTVAAVRFVASRNFLRGGRLQESRRRNCHFGLNSVRVGFDVLAFFLDAAGVRGFSGRGFNK